MSFKVGDKVSCLIQKVSDKYKVYLGEFTSDLNLESKKFEIVAIEPYYPGSEDKLYTLLIEDNMIGWNFNKWHVTFWEIPEKLLGKKFTQLTEYYFNKNLEDFFPKKEIETEIQKMEETVEEKKNSFQENLKKIKEKLNQEIENEKLEENKN